MSAPTLRLREMLEDDGISLFGALVPKFEPAEWDTPEWHAEMLAKYGNRHDD